jgi:hypothetical protein
MDKLDLHTVLARRRALADELASLEQSRLQREEEDRNLAIAERALKGLAQAHSVEDSDARTSARTGLWSVMLPIGGAALLAVFAAAWLLQARAPPSAPTRVDAPNLPTQRAALTPAPAIEHRIERRRSAPPAAPPTADASLSSESWDGVEVLNADELAAISQARANEAPP